MAEKSNRASAAFELFLGQRVLAAMSGEVTMRGFVRGAFGAVRLINPGCYAAFLVSDTEDGEAKTVAVFSVGVVVDFRDFPEGSSPRLSLVRVKK